MDDKNIKPVRFIDLFCGVGGFRYAATQAANELGVGIKCVFSSDIDSDCQDVYAANFGERPTGDITKITPSEIPDHDLLLAGFPCQPFSIIGKKMGFEDTRGTLFFNIASILEKKHPKAFVLENVKLLKGHDSGRTLKRIIETLVGLGYFVTYRVFNARNFGLPQNRERIFIVGFKGAMDFKWPSPDLQMKSLSEVLEKEIPKEYYVSDKIRAQRMAKCDVTHRAKPGIWHENKAGHISVYPYSCALRAGASYNYLLVDGIRRLTGREMFRLQGFPESFILSKTYGVARSQAGNSLPVPIAKAVVKNLMSGFMPFTYQTIPQEDDFIMQTYEEGVLYGT